MNPAEIERKRKYAERMRELLATVPPEFHNWIQTSAWERGHSSGYDEVIMEAECMIDDLAAPLKAYAERIKRERD